MAPRTYTAKEAKLIMAAAEEAITLYQQALAEVPDAPDLARAKALIEIGEGVTVDVDRIEEELRAASLARRAVPADADDAELPL